MTQLVISDGEKTTLDIISEITSVTAAENHGNTSVVEVQGTVEVSEISQEVITISITPPDETLILPREESEPLIVEAGTKIVIDNTVTVPEISLTAIAGESILVNSLVYIKPDGLVYNWDVNSSPTDVATLYLSKTSVIAGESIKIFSKAIVTNPMWNFIKGASLYISSSGWFTDTYSQASPRISWIVGSVTDKSNTIIFEPNLRITYV